MSHYRSDAGESYGHGEQPAKKSGIPLALKLGCLALMLPTIFIVIILANAVSSGLDEAEATASWPSVKGRILSSKVKVEKSRRRENGRVRTSTVTRHDIVYEYEVGGKKYRGSRVRPFRLEIVDAEATRAIVKKYSKGKVVDVFYNPDDPASSVLEPNTKKKD